jgi:hypothetical protein
MDWADEMIAVVERSDLIKAATIAQSQANYRLCADILDQVAKAEWDESKHQRDDHGRFTSSGRAAEVSHAIGNVAGRIAEISRAVETVLQSMHHVRSGQANIGHLLRLGSALHSLQRELRALPSDISELRPHARAALRGARDRLARVRAYVRSLRGKKPMDKRQRDQPDYSRKFLLAHQIKQLREELRT